MKKTILLNIFVTCLLVFGLVLGGCSSTTKSDEKVVKIGYQKGDPLAIVKSLGELDLELKKQGYKVEWKQFQDGTALTEALNAGSIDFGRTGNTPPVFSQIAKVPFVYVAAGKSKSEGSGILVPKGSAITSLADLKGKKIAFSKGTSSHYLLLKALQKAGLTMKDIKPIDLSPGDARLAFQRGQVDAWVVWDPYTASTEINTGAILLANGKGLTTDRDFFLASKKFAQNHKDVVQVIVKEISNGMDWANDHHKELIDMLAKDMKMNKKVIQRAVDRRIYGVDSLSTNIMNEQQDIADLFYNEKIVPEKINVMDNVMK
ncbi:sulfonate ABC transporter substrate-binding protein [Heyndrickxia ginsengihumi]|uniref:sulfonate ABC transporter substrate-binding protein n=1 Tax=Heyndrickxia ginsengihumi TaxID=363870 RepID=UPI0004717295|nr:sulfonate ABC transporter substrate-binding protein [Heyndrickxia ginsengihumi]